MAEKVSVTSQTPRISRLISAPIPSGDPIERGRSLCETMHDCGFAGTAVFEIEDSQSTAVLLAASGRHTPFLSTLAGMAERSAATGQTAHLLQSDEGPLRMQTRFAAVPIAWTDGGTVTLTVADDDLTLHEVQAIAAWASDPGSVGSDLPSALASSVARQFEADGVVFSLFAEAGMLLELRSSCGALVRRWRCPDETVWAEAARHGAAIVLGELGQHRGTETLNSIGMRSAGLVGVALPGGMAFGAVGVCSFTQLPVDVADRLLCSSGQLGEQVFEAFAGRQRQQRRAA